MQSVAATHYCLPVTSCNLVKMNFTTSKLQHTHRAIASK